MFDGVFSESEVSSLRAQLTPEQRAWWCGCVDGLTDRVVRVAPSEWAETERYLPPSVTSMPGAYSFRIAPYLKEIVDCLGVESPIREVAIMKGAQIGATVGVLENTIGYLIEHVRVAPAMMVTADNDLAKLRLESNITPMLQDSNLMHLIKSVDIKNSRKTGKTDKKIEWEGGGYLVPFGAQNANKLRSLSIQYLLNDEIDGWPETVGKEGDPLGLVRKRTASYEATRKILDISTPLIKDSSKIEKQYKRGDQRKYMVCCLRCSGAQELRWRHTDNDTGVISGIVWDTEDGRLVPDSVRYLCKHCGHPHTNADKVQLLDPKHGAKWVPTAVPAHPSFRSYHLSALYSPPGMQSWETCVQMWLEAWDEERNEPKDHKLLQVFYNTVLGETWEVLGEGIRIEQVSPHRRAAYHFGVVPNGFAERFCGSKVLMLTLAVDVHADNLAVAVVGWCRNARSVLIHYERLYGDVEHVDTPETWGRVADIIEGRVSFKSDDGREYRVFVTVIDSGYLTDQVYRFCDAYATNVFPVKGQDRAHTAHRVPEFSPFKTPNGTQCYGITVNLYKDRLAALLRRRWDGQNLQPIRHFNAPSDCTDKQLRELTGEVKVAKKHKTTGQLLGYEWHRRGANELWDLMVYSSAALDLTAFIFAQAWELSQTDWMTFWDDLSVNGEGALWVTVQKPS